MTRFKSFALVVVLIVALLAVHLFDLYLGRKRVEYEVSQPKITSKWKEVPLQELTGIVVGALFGGFRSQAADIIWWRSQEFFEDGHWDRVWPMMRATCYLDPYFKDAWMLLGWHEAYNMAAEADIQLSKGQLPGKYPEEWVQLGIGSYREGLKYNPGAADLYENLAWTFIDKLGEFSSGAKHVRMALMTWKRGRTEYRETDKILGRLSGHAWEQFPQIDEALDAYDAVLERYPTDNVGIGATITIRERYLPAWRAYQRKDYAKAMELINQRLRGDYRDRIALHLKALIAHASGDSLTEFVTWVMAGLHAKDRFAHRHLAQLLRSTGRYERMRGLYFADQVTTRNIEEYANQSRDMGVTLDLASNAELPDEATISIGVPDGKEGRARFFIDGFEVADISHPPYSFRLDPDSFPWTQPEILIHVEFEVPGETVPRWDVRLVWLPRMVTGFGPPQREMPPGAPMGPSGSMPPGMMPGPGEVPGPGPMPGAGGMPMALPGPGAAPEAGAP